MTNGNKILVTGGSGKTGSRIAKSLADLGYAVRTAYRGTAAPGNTNVHVPFDWFDEATYGPALNGVDKIYLVGPVAIMDPSTIVVPFMERAITEGVRRIVLLSSASLPEDGPVIGKVHRALRQLVPEWTVLRPSYFMQNFTEGHHGAQINSDGVMITATGSSRIGFVDADDIAEVGVRALVDECPHNTDHIITGPQSLSYAEAGEIIGAVAGRTIKHVNISTEELATGFTKFGMSEEYAHFLAGLDEAIKLYGTEDQTTDTVARITGRPPRSLHDFAVAHSSYWKRH